MQMWFFRTPFCNREKTHPPQLSLFNRLQWLLHTAKCKISLSIVFQYLYKVPAIKSYLLHFRLFGKGPHLVLLGPQLQEFSPLGRNSICHLWPWKFVLAPSASLPGCAHLLNLFQTHQVHLKNNRKAAQICENTPFYKTETVEDQTLLRMFKMY